MVSIVDPDAGAADAVGQSSASTARSTRALDAALRDDEVDAVVIATPNALHPAMTEAVARAGKHILLEKPLRSMRRHSIACWPRYEPAGVICQVNMILRWHPMIESIVRLREQGVLGEIHTVEADFVFGELEGSEPDWARTVADGGSLHLYAGCHAYDQLEWLMDDQRSKCLGIGPPLDKWEYDVTACAILRFARGGIGRATVTLEAAAPYQFGIRVFGTRGTVIDNTVCVPASMTTRSSSTARNALTSPTCHSTASPRTSSRTWRAAPTRTPRSSTPPSSSGSLSTPTRQPASIGW